MRKIIFFDRDGTLIIDKIYLNDPEGIEYLPGVFDGLKKLKSQGYSFIIVTNQSGVARNLVTIENLEKIHQNMKRDFAEHDIEILAFYYAPYSVESNHWMRKPNPGMIELGLKEFDGDRNQSWMVGDRMTDIEAGLKSQLRTAFINGTESPSTSVFKPLVVSSDFKTLCDQIIVQDDLNK